MARPNNRSISGGPSILNLNQERCCGKSDGKWSVLFWLDKVKVDDEAEGWPWRTILYRERNRLPKIKSPGADIESPRRAIFASGVNHSRLIDCPVG